MRLIEVRVGMQVKTNKRLGKTTGFYIVQKNLNARKPNKKGKILGYVPGHGGDVWWVTHKDGTVGAYGFDEFQPV